MSKVLIGITGSIAAYKTCTLISSLKKQGHEVKVVATKSALQFVGSATIEGLTGEPVYTDTFEPGKMMSHIHLARWADIFITAPCSLAQLSRFANGLADNLLTNIYFALTPDRPRFIAPAMNQQMWKNNKTQDLLKQLRDSGNTILQPTAGTLACGEVGQGRMMEPEDIESLVFMPAKKQRRVLITSGGTKERIDNVRYIGNSSTGKTGAILADTFAQKNFHVDLIHADGAILPNNPSINKYSYISFNDIKESLKALLDSQDYDLVIHAAAISDFSVENQSPNKIESTSTQNLKLVPNEKLISKIKSWSKGSPMIVGFKLTSGLSPTEQQVAIDKVLKYCDYVTHNRIEDIQNNRHSFEFYNQNGAIETGITADQLAQVIQDNLESNNKEVHI